MWVATDRFSSSVWAARLENPYEPEYDSCHREMSDITREKVHALAALANLELSDTEVDLFARQLRDFLEYAEAVHNIDTSGVPPTASMSTGDESDRPDVVGPSLPRESALANAPDAAPDAGFFRVPRVIG